MSSKRIRKKRASKWSNCPLCGRPLPNNPRKRIIGQENAKKTVVMAL